MSTAVFPFKLPTVPVAWLKRDLLLYANTIGIPHDQLQYLYELHPRFAAFPTYPIVLSFKGDSPEARDFYADEARVTDIPGTPVLDPSRFVDGERHLTQHHPIPLSAAPGEFELQTVVHGVYDKGASGSVKRLSHLLVETATGKLFTEIEVHTFAVGQGNWGGPRGPKSPAYPPPNRPPDGVYKFQTSEGQALLYRLNGDYNPLHADPEVGPKMGYKGAILHGLCQWGVAAQAVVGRFCGGDGGRLVNFGARFTAAVMSGDGLVVEMWDMGCSGVADGQREIRLRVRREGDDVTVIGNGRAIIKEEASSAKL